MEKGSVLVLTLIAVLILSGMAITGLTVSTTEAQSTQNFYLNKRAYYTAVEGVEVVRNLIYNDPAPENVTTLKKIPTDTWVGNTSMNYTYYVTGSMEDLQYFKEGVYELPTVGGFQGFDPPPLPSISMGGTISIAPVVWQVNITSEVYFGKKKSYSEIQSGIYSIVTVDY